MLERYLHSVCAIWQWAKHGQKKNTTRKKKKENGKWDKRHTHTHTRPTESRESPKNFQKAKQKLHIRMENRTKPVSIGTQVILFVGPQPLCLCVVSHNSLLLWFFFSLLLHTHTLWDEKKIKCNLNEPQTETISKQSKASGVGCRCPWKWSVFL